MISISLLNSLKIWRYLESAYVIRVDIRISGGMVRFVDDDQREIANLEPLLELVHSLLDPKCSDRGYYPI
jgi:hypothetical protein